jgi:CheY-like chemotaxis protein
MARDNPPRRGYNEPQRDRGGTVPNGVGQNGDGTVSRPSVIVVDDEPDVRMLLRIALELEGYRVLAEAKNGLEGLDRFHSLAPDSMIVDLSMPELGGIELIKRLRSRSSIPLVGYSAAPTREDERQLLSLGVPLVIKDAGIKALVRVLDTLTRVA